MPQQGYGPPSAEQYKVVKEVFEKTKVMAVKDKTTAAWLKPEVRCGGVPWVRPWQDVGEYGEDHRPKAAGSNADELGFASLTRLRRAVRVDHFGTPMLPNGVAIGGVETWRTPDVFGRKPAECVGWQSDLSPDEENRLARWARGIHHVTEEEYSKCETDAAFRAAHRLETQQDPAGALTKALAPALAEAFRSASGAQNMPSDAEMTAAGFERDAAGKWTRAVATAGGKR